MDENVVRTGKEKAKMENGECAKSKDDKRFAEVPKMAQDDTDRIVVSALVSGQLGYEKVLFEFFKCISGPC